MGEVNDFIEQGLSPERQRELILAKYQKERYSILGRSVDATAEKLEQIVGKKKVEKGVKIVENLPVVEGLATMFRSEVLKQEIAVNPNLTAAEKIQAFTLAEMGHLWGEAQVALPFITFGESAAVERVVKAGAGKLLGEMAPDLLGAAEKFAAKDAKTGEELRRYAELTGRTVDKSPKTVEFLDQKVIDLKSKQTEEERLKRIKRQVSKSTI